MCHFGTLLLNIHHHTLKCVRKITETKLLCTSSSYFVCTAYCTQPLFNQLMMA